MCLSLWSRISKQWKTRAEAKKRKRDEKRKDAERLSGRNGHLNSGRHGDDGDSLVKAKDVYPLMRDCDASSRLTAQHYLWKDLLGFLAHPKIPTGDAGYKVADVATGNGIWLHDFGREKAAAAVAAAPGVELHGFDISLDQVTARPWLPDNIHMHSWDVFDDPPARFVGYFDFVHVRLVTVVVKQNDPRPVLANLRKLLKPGGYLQWDEVDTINCAIRTVPDGSAPHLDELFAQLKGRDTWKAHLSRIMDENGFKGSRLYTYEYGPDSFRLWNDLYVSTWKEFAENKLKTPEASRELERKAMIEARSGAAIWVPKLVWVTRKAGGENEGGN